MEDRRRPTLVTTTQAAEIAGVPAGTIRSWAARDLLSRYGRVGGTAYYDPLDVLRVEAATRRKPRSARQLALAMQHSVSSVEDCGS